VSLSNSVIDAPPGLSLFPNRATPTISAELTPFPVWKLAMSPSR